MKKILLVSHEMTYTGAPRSLLNMAIAMRELKYDISVASLYPGEFSKEFINNHFNVLAINHPWDDYINYIKTFDLVIANTIFCLPFAHFSQGYSNVVLYIREAENINQICIECKINDALIKQIKQIVCVSEYARDKLKEQCGINNITVLHNYIDYEKRKVCNIFSSKTKYAVIGTVEPRKEQALAIAAFKEALSYIDKDCKLYIIGKFPMWSKEYWENFKENENIIFTGEITSRKELIKILSEIHVIIVPSKDESCSLVALEGAMLGKGLIISRNVGAEYVLSNKEYRFETGNLQELSWLIRKMSSRRVRAIEGIKNYLLYKKTSTKHIYKKNIKKYLDELE